MEKDSKLYRVEEMYDSMEESLYNIKELISQQKKLKELVEANSDEFADFIKELSEQLEQYEKQITVLEDRANELCEVIEICKDDEDMRDLLDKFIFAIGMFNE